MGEIEEAEGNPQGLHGALQNPPPANQPPKHVGDYSPTTFLQDDDTQSAHQFNGEAAEYEIDGVWYIDDDTGTYYYDEELSVWLLDAEDDDYLSLCSQDSDNTDTLLVNAWAAGLKHRKKGGEGKRKGRSKGGDLSKRDHTDDPPPGWTKEKWMARTPCLNCGSRFHQDCGQKGKGGKSRKKGDSPGRSAPKGGKGGPKGGRGGGKAFAVFMPTMLTGVMGSATAAALTAASTAWCLGNSDFTNIAECFNSTYQKKNFSTWTPFFDATSTPDINNTWSDVRKISINMLGIVHHWLGFSLEVMNFRSTPVKRLGTMTDTGAQDSVCGGKCKRELLKLAEKYGFQEFVSSWSSKATLFGVGGETTSEERCNLPIGVGKALCSWEAQILEGRSAPLPALMGLPSLLRLKAIIFMDSKEVGVTILGCDGARIWIPSEISNGHLMMPADEFPNQEGATYGFWQSSDNIDAYHMETLARQTEPEEEKDEGENTEKEESPIKKFFEKTLVTEVSKKHSVPPPPGLEAGVTLVKDLAGPANVTSSQILTLQRSVRKFIHMTSAAVKKYRGLDPSVQVPDITSYLNDSRRWDVWELCAGRAGVTKACKKLGLRCGFPVDYNNGWGIFLDHRWTALKEAYNKRRPRFIMMEPTCGIWSTSNTTMDPCEKEIIRARERIVLQRLGWLAQQQNRHGYDTTIYLSNQNLLSS